MDITGVTQTAQILPGSQPPPVDQSAQASQTTSTGADSVSFSAKVSTQVLDMAQKQFEDAANQLISSMAAATGVGQNIDLSV